MLTETEERTIAMRKLILRDALSILSLVLVTIVLFGFTLLLFRSFSAHRSELAQRWSDRGRRALQSGRPAEAMIDLRTALTYAPGTRSYELLLAQALGEAGHTEESYNYFMGLWESQPGDGFINLELARLAIKRNDPRAALNFYRASIYGTWEGDGVARRAQVRMELARYLIQRNQSALARMELLIVGGNSPSNYELDMTLADLFQQAGDDANGMTYYQKALTVKPNDVHALEAAGRLAYTMDDYEKAYRLLKKADAQRTLQHQTTPENSDDLTMMNNAARLMELEPLPSQSSKDRVHRILAALTIAKKRFEICSTQLAPDGQMPAAISSLETRWKGPDGASTASSLLRDPAQQDSSIQLVYDSEIQTEKFCGAPTGDDALLLQLANQFAASQAASGAGSQSEAVTSAK